MVVSRFYKDHWQAPPKLRWLGGGEWQGTMGLCVTKEKTADCQLTEEPINYTWNPLYNMLEKMKYKIKVIMNTEFPIKSTREM